MIELLAQGSAPEAAAIGEWLKVFFWLSGSIAALVVAFKKSKQKDPAATPQPLRVKADADYVTTTAHDKVIGEIKEELKRHGARRAEIYDTQKEQSAAIARLDEKTDLMNAQLVRQDGKIDRILERLPR